MRVAALVDWDALLEVVAGSFVVAVGVTIAFSLAIYGTTRLADMRREPHARTETVAFTVLTAGGIVVTVGAIVLGLIVMLSK